MFQKPYKILIIDDEQICTDLVTDILKHQYKNILEPITTNSPEEAVQIIKKELIPLIITDINMPNFSGEDIIQTAKDRLSHTQVIVITGLAKKSTAMACLHDGAACMIIKPFTISQVKRCLDNCIERIEIWNEVLSY